VSREDETASAGGLREGRDGDATTPHNERAAHESRRARCGEATRLAYQWPPWWWWPLDDATLALATGADEAEPQPEFDAADCEAEADWEAAADSEATDADAEEPPVHA